MSRIPVPSHSASYNRSSGASERSNSPLPFPERASSPLPPSRFSGHSSATMSTISSSAADTRRKQSRKDEVCVLSAFRPVAYGVGAYSEGTVRIRTGRVITERGLHVFAVCCPQNARLLRAAFESCARTRPRCHSRARSPRLRALSQNAVYPRVT